MIKVINDNGRPWSVEILDDKVKFYDARYEHTALGQFVSSYYINTILDGEDTGLCLDFGIPEWSISMSGMIRIRRWLRESIGAEQ